MISLTHFRVLICGKLARIIRWDRNGAIASHAFNYTRFLHFNPDVERRGHNPAVTIMSKRKVNEVNQTRRGIAYARSPFCDMS
jgi:hypothetical protein